MHPTPTAAQLENLRGHYQLHFVDRPRATRSLAMLEKLQEALQAVGAAAAPAQRREASALKLAWQAEAKAVAATQRQCGSGGQAAVEALEEARRVRWRVARQLRLHPDPLAVGTHQLEALLADVSQTQAALQAIPAEGWAWAAQNDAAGPGPEPEQPAEANAAPLASTTQQLAHVAAHLDALRAGVLAAAHGTDLQLRVRAGVVAARAALADLAHVVAGRNPVVVRPDYLSALVADLGAAHLLMAQTPGGGANAADKATDAAAHRQNCEALGEQVQTWQQQLRRVVAKRRQHTADEMAHAVAAEADAVMEAADAAHALATPANAATYLALRMDELHRQLTHVPLVFGHAHHRDTLAGLADCLAWLERGAGPSVANL